MGTPTPQQRLRHGGDAETSPPFRVRSGQAYRTAVAPRTGLPPAFAKATSGKQAGTGIPAPDQQRPAIEHDDTQVAARMPLLREGTDESQGEAGMGTAGLRETADGRRAGADPSTALRAGLRALQNGGVILVLGRPEPVLPSGSCYVEVKRVDGSRSVAEQSVERDAVGRPQMVRISYEQIEPDAASVQQGG
jgi:hypothetical protein